MPAVGSGRAYTGLWYRFLYRAFAEFNYHRVRIVDPPPASDLPTLYLGLHRNGALDGAVYRLLAPRMAMTPASQLRRDLFSRLIFTGIEILRVGDRQRDGSRINNAEAFRHCAEHLAAGGDLLFFPEGTSDLGAAHLPFKPGVAKLIQATLAIAPALRIVPLAAHYEDPTVWQSNVEVLAGAPFRVTGEQDRRDLMARITAALEAVSLDCATLEERRQIEALAYAATLGSGLSYARALKIIADWRDEVLTAEWQALQAQAAAEGLRLHQGVPLLPLAGPPLYLAGLIVLSPLLAVAALANLPVLAACRWATRRFPDAPNVIALWRAIAGVGSALLWVPLATLLAGWLGGMAAALAYLAFSALGLKSLYRWRKLVITVHNGWRASTDLRQRLKTLHAGLVQRVLGDCR